MATLTPLQVNNTANPVLITYAAASGGGDTIATGGLTNVILKVRNGSGSAITVTLAGTIACSQGATHNVVVSCAATSDTEIPVPAQCINAVTGNVAVTYSAVTTVTVAVTDYVA
jgi:hypothetical protein